VAVATEVAALIADDLGWTDDEATADAEAFIAQVRREREAAALSVPTAPPASAAS
jgi:hypothetical protein